MSKDHYIKKELYILCKNHIEQRITSIKNGLLSIEESRNNETKSSAGDKFETGRAMMQIEEDKIKKQLSEAIIVKSELSVLQWEKNFDKVSNGSLVLTDKGNYFISIGVGKIDLKDKTYFCISAKAPIAKALFNNEKGDKISFREMEISIEDIL